MAIEVRLPQLAEGMKSGKLAAWLKREGDVIATGDVIAEVETDKTNVELEAPGAGILRKIHVLAGTDSVAVGELLATIGERATEASQPPAAEEATLKAPSREVARIAVPPAAAAAGGGHNGGAIAGGVADESPAAERIPATPLARRMALVAGLDLSQIRGGMSGARITKADVERVLRQARPTGVDRPEPPPSIAKPPVQPAVATTALAHEDRPLTAMRRVTAERLQQSKQTIPHFYLTIDCSVDALMELRSRLNADDAALKVTVTDFTIRAAALALRKVPSGNAAWAESAVRVYDRADIAVAVNTPAGLITPIVRGADQKSVATISRKLKELAERAREGRLKPDEYSGGTFTISNLGMFGVTSLYPIVNPPQSAILGVGAIQQRPVVRDGSIAIGSMMTCTLSADHRVVDGAAGAELLAEFRRLIEHPLQLLI